MEADLRSRPNGGSAPLRSKCPTTLLIGETLAQVSIRADAPRDLSDDVEAADWAPDGTNLAMVHVVNSRAG